MSVMQGFRDGPRPGVWREIWGVLRMLCAFVATLAGFVLAVWCAYDKQWSEATFFLVLAWIAEGDFKRWSSDNG